MREVHCNTMMEAQDKQPMVDWKRSWQTGLMGWTLLGTACGSGGPEIVKPQEDSPSAETILVAPADGSQSEDLPAWTGEVVMNGDGQIGEGAGSPSEVDDFQAAQRNFNQGSDLVAEGRFGEAVPLLKRAAEINPDDEEIHYHLAFSLSRLNRPEEAITHYERTLEIFPEYAEARINLGNLYMNRGSFQEAEEAFRAALEVAPELASVHNNLGTLLSRQGRAAEAIPLFTQAVTLDPDYIQAFCNLGNAYLSQGRAEEAAKQFTRALAIRADFPPAMSGLQRARIRIGPTSEP